MAIKPLPMNTADKLKHKIFYISDNYQWGINDGIINPFEQKLNDGWEIKEVWKTNKTLVYHLVKKEESK